MVMSGAELEINQRSGQCGVLLWCLKSIFNLIPVYLDTGGGK